MACLRSFSRRSLYPKLLCYMTSRPVVLHHQDPKSTFPESSLLIRSFHRHVFEDRTIMSFAQPVYSSGVLLLCRHMSSKPEELCSKIDALGNVVEDLVSEKPVEAIVTNVSTINECTASIESFSFPGNFVHYVINGIHELTGFNWAMSIVLTAFLVSVLMSPISMRVQKQAQDLESLTKSIENAEKMIKVGNRESRAKYKKWETELLKRFEDSCFPFLTLVVPDAFVYISFLSGITTMAKKVPDLSISDSLYILPLLAGVTFWFSFEINNRQTNLLSSMKRLPLFPIIFVVLQATFEFEPAMYFYMITSRFYLSTLCMMLKSNQIVKLRSILGRPDVTVTTVSEQQKIMGRLISVMREFTDVVKKKDKK